MIAFSAALIIIALMQTNIFIPLRLVLAIYLAGITIDNISTYLFGKTFGMMSFFHLEENIGTKDCVKKYGLLWGLIATELRPSKIFTELVLIAGFGFVTILLAKNIDVSPGLLFPGLLFIGSQRIYAGLSNLNVIREEYRPYHLNKLAIEEEQ